MERIKISENYYISEKYDEKQRNVISFDNGYHLVLASAGCGKTDILAERVNRAIHMRVQPEDMLCLTFTNRASRGMKYRVKHIIGEKSKNLFIGNTHRFCSKFLFENNIVAQSSSIMDEEDTLSVINDLSQYIMIDAEDKAEAASLDFEDRKRLTAVLQIQHLMMQYRMGHPKSVIMSNSSDYKDSDKSEKFYSPQQFALLCKELGLPVTTESLLSIYDNSEFYLKSDNFSHHSNQLLFLMDTAKKYEEYKERENVKY